MIFRLIFSVLLAVIRDCESPALRYTFYGIALLVILIMGKLVGLP